MKENPCVCVLSSGKTCALLQRYFHNAPKFTALQCIVGDILSFSFSLSLYHYLSLSLILYVSHYLFNYIFSSVKNAPERITTPWHLHTVVCLKYRFNTALIFRSWTPNGYQGSLAENERLWLDSRLPKYKNFIETIPWHQIAGTAFYSLSGSGVFSIEHDWLVAVIMRL